MSLLSTENVDREPLKDQQQPDVQACVVKLTKLTEEGLLLCYSFVVRAKLIIEYTYL